MPSIKLYPTVSSPTGRVALVTGAGQRLGQAIALHLAEKGFSLAVHYAHSKEGALQTQHAVRKLGVQAEIFRADLSRADSSAPLVDKVVKRFGRLDALVGSAANFERVKIADCDLGYWERALQLNVRANYLLALQCRTHLKETRGSMVFITCTSTQKPYKNYLPYEVSKAALKQLMRILAMELAPSIRVNAVAPGTVLPPDNLSKKTIQSIVRRTLLGRMGHPTDIARAVAYLIDAPFVTGQELVVDGGATLFDQ